MQNSYIKKIILIIFLIIVGFGVFMWSRAVSAWATGELYGYACNPSNANLIGCISMNNISSSGSGAFTGQPSSFAVTFNRLTSEFAGTGWSPRIGVVSFGQTCPSFITSVIAGSGTGKKCAHVNIAPTTTPTTTNTDTASGWGGWIYVGGVTYTLGTETLSGKGWEAWNSDNRDVTSDVGIGYIDFNTVKYALVGCTQSSATNYNSNATVDDNTCTYASSCGSFAGIQSINTIANITSPGSGAVAPNPPSIPIVAGYCASGNLISNYAQTTTGAGGASWLCHGAGAPAACSYTIVFEICNNGIDDDNDPTTDDVINCGTTTPVSGRPNPAYREN